MPVDLIRSLGADVVIAVHGEFGTLSEIALALKHGVPVVGLGTWRLDHQRPPGMMLQGFHLAETPEQAVELALTLARAGRLASKARE